MFKKIGLIALAVSTLLLVGCGGGSSKSTPVTSIGQIVNLWDFTDDGDVAYLNVQEDGKIVVYDYLKDTFDEGPDCYDQYLFATVTQTGDNTFQLQFSDNTTANITSTLDNDILSITNTTTGEVSKLPEASINLSEIQSNLCQDM